MPCGRLRCRVCVKTEAGRSSRAIALARPDYSVLLTQVGDDWPQVRKRMARFREVLRRRRVQGEYAYHVEENPEGTGLHVHLWYRGKGLTERAVREAADRAHMGLAWVRPAYLLVGEDGQPRLGYGFKNAYDLAGPVPGVPKLTTHLELNGGRLVHTTRGFWLDAAGRRVRHAEAKRAADCRGSGWRFQPSPAAAA